MSKESPKVMVVEDEDLLLQAVLKKFETQGIEGIGCTSGEQALDYLGSLEELPDAIWLDYHLKSMNGLEFMQKVRANEKWRHIPVLVVSNSASEEKVHSMLALGAKQYLLKAEHRLDDLIERIKQFIAQEEESS